MSSKAMHSFELHKFTLTTTENLLRERLEKDVQNGTRSEDIIEKSLARLALYEEMNTIKVQNNDLNATIATIVNHINGVE